MLSSMAKGSRAWNRWRRDNQRKLKARLKKQAAERGAARAAKKSS
jgi:hypothetical protein